MEIHIHTSTVNISPAGGFAPDLAGGVELFASTSTNPISTIPQTGQPWPEQGGVVAGFMPPENDQPGYWLIVPTDAAAEAKGLKWGPSGEAEGIGNRDGKRNTEILVKAAIVFPAAQFCAGLKLGEFSDFYLPSRREASLMAATVPHLFAEGLHWTSTQYSAYGAFVQDFSDGHQGLNYKDGAWRVRAVRRFITT